MIDVGCTCFVVSSGKPAQRSKRSWRPTHAARTGVGSVAAIDAGVPDVVQRGDTADIGQAGI